MEHEHFTESEVDFELPKDFLFRIEKCKTLSSLQGIKTAEFLLLDDKNSSIKIWIVEAKLGSPQPAKEEDFNKFINEIKDKLYDSLSLFIAMYLGRHLKELPTSFQQVDLERVSFNLVLLMTSQNFNKNEDWVSNLQNSLQDVLNPLVRKMPKIWKFCSNKIIVMNIDTAQQYGLIKNYSSNHIIAK